MIRNASKNKKTSIILTIILISSITITSVLTTYFLQSNFKINTDTISNQVPKQPSAPISVTGTNQTNILNEAKAYNNHSSSALMTNPISADILKFKTYTYRGYPVQQPNPTHFFFSFPDNTSQGQMAGSDAVTLNTYAIQKVDFDAGFIAPKISALGFDEMVIFVTSNVITYKGTEFGIRLDLRDGFI